MERYFRENGKWAKVSGKRGRWASAHGWQGDIKAIRTFFYATKSGAEIAAKHWVSE